MILRVPKAPGYYGEFFGARTPLRNGNKTTHCALQLRFIRSNSTTGPSPCYSNAGIFALLRFFGLSLIATSIISLRRHPFPALFWYFFLGSWKSFLTSSRKSVYRIVSLGHLHSILSLQLCWKWRWTMFAMKSMANHQFIQLVRVCLVKLTKSFWTSKCWN